VGIKSAGAEVSIASALDQPLPLAAPVYRDCGAVPGKAFTVLNPVYRDCGAVPGKAFTVLSRMLTLLQQELRLGKLPYWAKFLERRNDRCEGPEIGRNRRPNAVSDRFSWRCLVAQQKTSVTLRIMHPEFGLFCPQPRWRRDVRVAFFSLAFGICIGTITVGGPVTEKRNLLGTDTADIMSAGVAPHQMLSKHDDSEKAEAKSHIGSVRARTRDNGPSIGRLPLGRAATLEEVAWRDVPVDLPSSAELVSGMLRPSIQEGPGEAPHIGTPTSEPRKIAAQNHHHKQASARRARRASYARFTRFGPAYARGRSWNWTR
jgi:hypothetical protein